MLAFGCILMGLGIGLILGNVEETMVLSLIGLIAGGFLYTKMGVYVDLKCNKKAKNIAYIAFGIFMGVIVGLITQEIIGSIITGIGAAIIGLNLSTYRHNRRSIKKVKSKN